MSQIMIIIFSLISSSFCLDLQHTQGNADSEKNENTTTLYPVKDHFKNVKETHNENVTKLNVDNKKYNPIDNNNSDKIKATNTLPKTKFNILQNIKDDINDSLDESNEENVNTYIKDTKSLKTEVSKWNIDAIYSSSKLNKAINETSKDSKTETDKSDENNKTKEFKPSPHLGNFFDEGDFIIPTPAHIASFSPVLKKPTSGFVSSPEDFIKLEYKKPIDFYNRELDYSPYKYDDYPRPKDWQFPPTGLEPKPTMESPVKIPAGGLYKHQDAFKEKPGLDGDDDDFGLDFKDQKDTSIKKRRNPWKNLLNLVTALVPVGIIISALTPNIITLETTDNQPYYRSRISRRSEGSVAELPVISEGCKRRLLCEIHSDRNYKRDISPRRQKHCYKIRCGDPEALNRVLQWLLVYHHTRRTGHLPAVRVRRGSIT